MIQALKCRVCVIITAVSVNVKFTVANSSPCSNMHSIWEEKACFNSVILSIDIYVYIKHIMP